MSLTGDLLARIRDLSDEELNTAAYAFSWSRDEVEGRPGLVYGTIAAMLQAERRRRRAEWKAKERDLQSDRVSGWWGYDDGVNISPGGEPGGPGGEPGVEAADLAADAGVEPADTPGEGVTGTGGDEPPG